MGIPLVSLGMAGTLTGQDIRITALVPVGGELADTTFIRCAIHGPAILYGDRPEDVTFRGTYTFNARSSAAVLWPIGIEREAICGVLHLTNCVFEDCTFQNIGMATRDVQKTNRMIRGAWNGHS